MTVRGVPTSSVAPWILSVAASSTDRRIVNKLVLGNSTSLAVCGISILNLTHIYTIRYIYSMSNASFYTVEQGNAINSFHLEGDGVGLIYGKDATSQCPPANAR